MEMKDFDKLEQKINRLVQHVKEAREENQKLKIELHNVKQALSQKDGERGDVKKKITSLLELIDSLDA